MKSAKIINSSDAQVDRPGLWFYSWSTKTYSKNIPSHFEYDIRYNDRQLAYFNSNLDLAVFPEALDMIQFKKEFEFEIRRCWGKDFRMYKIGRLLKLEDFEIIV